MSETNLPVFHTPPGQVLIYRDGALNLQVRLDGQTVWLTQAAIAQLYQTTPQNITIHLKANYGEGELDETATCKNYLQVRQEGSRHVSPPRSLSSRAQPRDLASVRLPRRSPDSSGRSRVAVRPSFCVLHSEFCIAFLPPSCQNTSLRRAVGGNRSCVRRIIPYSAGDKHGI